MLGFVLNQINAWSLFEQTTHCLRFSPCYDLANQIEPFVYIVDEIVFGSIATIALCWVGFALVNLRPLVLSVPLGVLLTLGTVLVYNKVHAASNGVGAAHEPGVGPWWLVVLVFAAVFAVFAVLIAVSRRYLDGS